MKEYYINEEVLRELYDDTDPDGRVNPEYMERDWKELIKGKELKYAGSFTVEDSRIVILPSQVFREDQIGKKYIVYIRENK